MKTGFGLASCHCLLLAGGPEHCYLLYQPDIKSLCSLHAPLLPEPKEISTVRRSVSKAQCFGSYASGLYWRPRLSFLASLRSVTQVNSRDNRAPSVFMFTQNIITLEWEYLNIWGFDSGKCRTCSQLFCFARLPCKTYLVLNCSICWLSKWFLSKNLWLVFSLEANWMGAVYGWINILWLLRSG